MMSTIGLFLLGAYLVGLLIYFGRNKLNEYCWIVFCATINISLFVNVGSCFLNSGYSKVATAVCIFTCAVTSILYNKVKVVMSRRVLFSAGLLVFVLLISLLNLAVNPNMPTVLAMDTNMDHAYYGSEFASKAKLSISNRGAFIEMCLFIVLLICFQKELSDSRKVNLLLDAVQSAFHVFMIAAVVEFVINNTVSPRLLRDFVFSITGRFDSEKTFYPQNRFGFYGVTLLFTEHSYISVMLIYYAIIWVRGIQKNGLFFYVLSMFVLLISGCSTGVLLMPFALLTFVREFIHRDRSRSIYRKLMELAVLFGFLIATILLVLSKPAAVLELIDQSAAKLLAAFYGGSSGASISTTFESGTIRNYGNSIAMRAFQKSPILGVGIGTTRGYGIWTGLLATFGISGIAAFLYFIDKVVDFKLKGKITLFIIICVYFSIVLSVWYAYMPALIPIYLVFSKHTGQYAKEAV